MQILIKKAKVQGLFDLEGVYPQKKEVERMNKG
ncbi:hypothetical protein M2391_001434 [Myroides odoratus]|nr:hypothetical protein [Myroides odoratus]